MYFSVFTKSLLKSTALIAVVSLSARAQDAPVNNVQLGLFYPFSTNGTAAPSKINDASFNLISGVSLKEKAFTFSGLTSIVKSDASGLQFAGFSNHVGGRSEGVLFAGFMNTYGEGEGLQFAGFSNIARKNVSGAQFSGFLNRAKNVSGFQFAGFSNVADSVQGAQFAGFANTSKEIRGSQFSGFINVADSQSHGSQFAGFINKAKDIDGSQFAGFINVARKVKGAQIAGFINVADSSDYPIGIINIIRNGEKSIGVSTDDNATSLVTFRSGGRRLYGIFGAGYNFDDRANELYALEAGLGAHFPLSNAFRINTELSTLALQTFRGGEYFKSSVRLLPAVKLGRIELYGGPAFNWVNTNTSAGQNLTSKYLAEWRNGNDYFRGIYIGYMGGLQFIF